jgi:AGZA family xanthine/uracil permease-like MFS transporter
MISKYFELQQKQTNVRIEFVAGITTFLTMAYIIFANPLILSVTEMDREALIAVTCLVTAIATIIVGIFANAPIAMAPGMGLNAFFAYLVASGKMDPQLLSASACLLLSWAWSNWELLSAMSTRL